MPPSQDVFVSADLRQSTNMRDLSLTPPTDASPISERMQSDRHQHVSSYVRSARDDNTAAGMALSQEDSMYLTPAASPTMAMHDEKDQPASAQRADRAEEDAIKYSYHLREDNSAPSHHENTTESPSLLTPTSVTRVAQHGCTGVEPQDNTDVDAQTNAMHAVPTPTSSPPRMASPGEQEIPHGLAKIDTELDRTRASSVRDFTDKRPNMKCPSALFQPYSKYIGTQQSDRHTYNVEVTILTVDMDQCSMAGYLLINGLTPEHPTLQTFFTGQIVGGPVQRYSFKTTDPAWGANDKVDLQHWLRFPPWRHLSAHAKRDMRFEFPLNGEPWWTQDHVFMRWKEHFLVPDHRESNITGASFEGFYYICLNMAEGKISGVYFHSKSERYQQLELTHETKRGLGIFGVSPLVELR